MIIKINEDLVIIKISNINSNVEELLINIINEEIKVDYKENDNVSLNLNIFYKNQMNNNNNINKKENEDNKI